MQNKKIQLWALSIAGYNCKIEYVKGEDNHCADLLSRIPHPKTSKTTTKSKKGEDEPDIDDRALEIGALNSNEFIPRDFASCHVQDDKEITKAVSDLPEEFDMKEAQEKDQEITKLRNRMKKGTATKAEQTHYFEDGNGLLYYLSQPDSEDPKLRLCIPQEMETVVLKQYHDQLGHMALDKTYDSIRLKYFFPNMYKKIHSHIEKCVTCQTRSSKTSRPPIKETEIPPYPFAKIGLDLSGPYPTTMSGNKYIVSFIDVYSGWPEALAVPDKSADRIVHLILEEIFPRFGCPLEIVSDNGTENVNKKVQETLDAMNIHHITTSFYSPQANGKVERFHRTLHDVMSKKIQEDVQTWDLYLNQTLAAIRFHVNESSKFSPYFLLYNRDVVLPLDTILKPRKRYMGEDQHQIALQQQHKAFTLVHRNMKEAKKKQKKYADKKSKEENFQIGDPVYLRNHRRNNKLDIKWKPYFRIIDQTGPLSFKVKNQLDGTTTKTHARHLRQAKIDEWKVPRDSEGNILRKTTYVVPPENSDSESDVDEPTPQDVAIRHRLQEREGSSDEDDIPLMELRRRLRSREVPPTEIKPETVPVAVENSRDEEQMEIDAVLRKDASFLHTEEASPLKTSIKTVPHKTSPDPNALINNLVELAKMMISQNKD
ncbi:hypothetical protein FSP39_001638 [Pinctada imbricata]|uniref:Integrase catalytic domain-containing protein n=1 Tax=Pinctada imbricata TaxID=66713 RepID=A0AA88YWG5_PINIB|nr:hypothetical protein FSP39_001638 [Pinctada imbricata]